MRSDFHVCGASCFFDGREEYGIIHTISVWQICAPPGDDESRFDLYDKGELVEAYYGKIYGDFEFEGDDKKGLVGVKFLYYLNPKSLDRNLEWDMKANLCLTAGKHESQQP